VHPHPGQDRKPINGKKNFTTIAIAIRKLNGRGREREASFQEADREKEVPVPPGEREVNMIFGQAWL
jgi:hypothetical protein